MTTETLTQRTTAHATFTVERSYPAAPARVFKAFADEQAKAKWFAPGFVELEKRWDFRVDGQEVLVGRHASGMVSAFYCTYHDIVPDERIVYAYRMALDGLPISSSLAVIEIRSEGTGAHLTVTERGVFLDGYQDNGSREHGTNWLMDLLGASLAD
jgi:uncharacterized protein YndB with AHSA1/START domain